MKTVANRDIPGLVRRKAQDVQGYGSMSSFYTPNGIRRGGYTVGWLPKRLVDILQERADSITQVIYSYDTPIAWLDAGEWIYPLVRYTATTGKHQSYVRGDINFEYIPIDCSLGEYERVLNAQLRFVRDGDKLVTRRGHRYTDGS